MPGCTCARRHDGTTSYRWPCSQIFLYMMEHEWKPNANYLMFRHFGWNIYTQYKTNKPTDDLCSTRWYRVLLDDLYSHLTVHLCACAFASNYFLFPYWMYDSSHSQTQHQVQVHLFNLTYLWKASRWLWQLLIFFLFYTSNRLMSHR